MFRALRIGHEETRTRPGVTEEENKRADGLEGHTIEAGGQEKGT